MRTSNPACRTCGHPTKNGLCAPPSYEQVMKRIFKPRMTDAEANKVVIPNLGPDYLGQAGNPTPLLKLAKRNRDGSPVVASNGDGKMRLPKGGWSIDGDPVERYLEAMGAPKCCTWYEPCDKHRGALRGRDDKTGEYL